jgi:molybdopterin-guanine dinucleotide biosynthesis protein A
MDITGIVLAGGMGRRMGGVDKGLAQFRGKPLVSHVIDRFSAQVSTILISANRELESYQQFGYPVVTDAISGYAGPLAGLHAGLRQATTPLVATAPCDTPFLPTDLVSKLMDALQTQHADIAVAKTGDQLHPVFCLCKTSLRDNLAQFLESGGRKMETWYKTLKYIEVPFDDQEQAFTNLNTPDELEAAT